MLSYRNLAFLVIQSDIIFSVLVTLNVLKEKMDKTYEEDPEDAGMNTEKRILGIFLT